MDNYDSFTYNLAQQVEDCTGKRPIVVRNDVPLDSIDLTRFSHIILSPGPGSPDVPSDIGICADILRTAEVPVLGVCLGHQLLASYFGGEVTRAPEAMHGRISKVTQAGDVLFNGLPQSFEVVRYHSLAVSAVPEVLAVTAIADDGVVMGLRHRSRPLWGVQFHPESVLSQWGTRIVENFLATNSNSEPRPSWTVEVRSLGAGLSPEQVYTTLYGDDPRSFWLDSNSGDERSRTSVMGTCEGVLSHVLEYKAGAGQTIRVAPDGTRQTNKGDIFMALEAEIESFGRATASADTAGFNLGYVGYLGYGLKADTCGVPDPVASPLPDARLTFAERAVVFDHVSGQCQLLALTSGGARRDLDDASSTWLDETASVLLSHVDKPDGMPKPFSPFPTDNELERSFSFRHERSDYIDRIKSCKQYILDGESYEICMTNTVEFQGAVDPLTTYSLLRARARVPYGAFLRCEDFSVLSASPECFLTIDGSGAVETRPIKGTRPRGSTPEDDLRLKDELVNSEKDRAENLMIVDLMRNDLNTVCEKGSVHVPSIFDVESFPSVHQLISTVCGRLRRGSSPVDCVRSAFPGGSMTGAPKIRTLQIIDELEETPRGIYSGAIGWFSLDGGVSLSIVIRTIVVEANRATFGVGGAITHLSDPEEEYEETLVKARVVASALLSAVEAR
ncbi:aminodeoxychorismate synthase component I [Leucobacter sp. M11]|uniref:aminodeoxychorismate synthase component I n=1 Tax=Leucobacter sp. M11 TaxID=2993565 RepID=UPI002D7F99FD|nr:aminodeoxychorismate synthase component I [Leucobacter sp. M11]MEB4613731.1 aminodeoxychorismate synthase component I [Leucobacter sp. M11]